MTGPVGYVIARDLGDGRVEPWEAYGGTVPLRPSVEVCRQDMEYGGAAPGVWRVYALTEVDAS